MVLFFSLSDDGIFRGDVACVPFFKFFNHGESLAYYAPDDEIVSIQRKYDGSLIKVFQAHGHWHIATNGTSKADENFITLFEKAIGLERKDFGTIFNHDKVYIFELCTPDNKIVVCYDGYYAKLLLTRCNETWDELVNEPNDDHYQVVEEVLFDPLQVGEEGVVVVYKGGHRVKKKTNWYRTLYKNFKGKGFNGTDLDSIERAIHAGFYDDVTILCSESGKRHGEQYRNAIIKFTKSIEDKLATLNFISGLEVQQNKDVVVQYRSISKG